MKNGVLLINLGSPDSTKVEDVRKYLREFLMDPMVLDTPYLVRKFVVEFAILPKRPAASAEAYESIWWDEGSPLIVLSKRLKNKVSAKVEIPVALGMRYQNPSIQAALQELHDQGVTNVLVIPLYPQYTMSSTETVVLRTNEIQQKYFKNMNLTFLNSFYNRPDYIEVLAENIKSQLPEKFDKLLFSYHGIPERHDNKAKAKAKKYPNANIKTYRDQCFETTELVRQAMGLEKDQVQVSFQSRLGKDPWIKPYTDFVLKDFPQEGVKNLAVVAPAFVSDCLETLEEIAIGYKELYLESGGENYTYIPCLNESEAWVDVLVKWIEGWNKNEA
ncbi:ferrochelatase [Moheibacter stercoris]|uniref:Ferrochelatase n=1 Tax=Moheibacter stercoris TaxID=1628251 RepID=A0ABV2LT67_9FLAO